MGAVARWLPRLAMLTAAALLVAGCARGAAVPRAETDPGGPAAATGESATDDEMGTARQRGPLPADRQWVRAVISYGPLETELTDPAVVADWGEWLSEREPAPATIGRGTTGPVLTMIDSAGEQYEVTVLGTWTVGAGRLWASGPGVPPSYSASGIWGDVGAALLAPERLAAYVEQRETSIVAHDRGMRVTLDPDEKTQLATLLRDMTESGSWTGSPLYPHLEIVVDHVPILTLARSDRALSPDWARHTAYSNAAYDLPYELYEFAAGLFPPEQADWSSFRSLFGADSVLVTERGREPWTIPAASWRADALVRVFLEAAPVPHSGPAPVNDPELTPDFVFLFQHGDTVVEVTVTGEIVTYAGRAYRLAITVEQLRSMLAAG